MWSSIPILTGALVELIEIDSESSCLQEEGDELLVRLEEKKAKNKVLEDYRTIKIATHNINGIKGNASKLELLLEWASKENIDMLGINETNTTERQNKLYMSRQKEYLEVWTNAVENKKKGSRVGLVINKKWEKHLSQVKRSSAYYIEALFIFKRQKLLVIVVYILHND